MKWFLIISVIFILLIIFVYNVINQNESKALFFPTKGRYWRPKSKYDNLYININNEKDYCYSPKDKKSGESYIHCWHFNNFKNEKTVCFFHGTTGNITNRKYIIDLCNKFHFNLFLFDYSGYGESSDFVHKFFLRENGETVYKYLNKECRIPSKDIIIWTESLGCITGSYICSKYNCGGLIILSGFSSLDDILNYGLEGYKKYASQLLTSLLSYKMDYLPVKDYLYRVKCPVIIVHSEEDEIVPYECSRINYKNIRHKDKLFIKIEGIHSAPRLTTKQLRKMFEFFDLPHHYLSSKSISYMLKDLETFAERHNNFME